MARPREFDHEKVMSKMMKLFWEKGFKGTSMIDLVKTTGLNKGSLYSCFGNKEEIFKLALNHYLTLSAAAGPRKESAIATLCQFYSYVVSEADLPKKQRRGCFVFNSCLEFGNQNSSLTPFVLSIGKQREAFFEGILQEAQEKGEIPEQVEVASAAKRAFATAFTIREMSKFKPEKDFLLDLANSFLESIGTSERLSVSGVHPI
jgi:TetR/AcrR family transcriptional repressor of nem operon